MLESLKPGTVSPLVFQDEILDGWTQPLKIVQHRRHYSFINFGMPPFCSSPTSASLPSQWLDEAAENWPNKLFLCGHQPRSFSQARRDSQAICQWLQQQHIGHGDRIAILMPNRAEVVLIALAALKRGVIFTVLTPQLQPSGLARILDQCQPKALFTDNLTSSLAEARSGMAKVNVDSSDWQTVLTSNLSLDSETETPRPEDVAFLVFTSGSTGTPRGVMLTQSNVAFVCRAILQRLAYQSEDRIGVILPLAFDYGLYQIYYACLSGASLFLGAPEMVGPELPKILFREEITILPAVPGVVAALLKMQRFRPTALPLLRMITNTGDHLPQAYITQIQTLLPQAKVYPMFGLTECKRVSILLPEELPSHPDSVGRALEGTTVFTVNEEGQRLPAGEVGELVVQGPHLAVGYWQAPDETAQRYREVGGIRSLFSGDQGSVDEEGFIRFLSRADFIIKHRGNRLNPAEVEEAACELPGIMAAGCVKDDTQDLLVLFISTQDPAPSSADTLTALAHKLERAKIPDRVIVLKELPRTPNQKLDRKALRRLLPTS